VTYAVTTDEIVAAAALIGSVAFMLGHAAGYWRARDVERRRRDR